MDRTSARHQTSSQLLLISVIGKLEIMTVLSCLTWPGLAIVAVASGTCEMR